MPETAHFYYGTGRRKSAVARVFLKPGKGEFVVNGKPVDQFFARETGRMVVRQSLAVTKNLATFDILVNVYGGGESGQAGAAGRPRPAPRRSAASSRRGRRRPGPGS